MNWDLSKYLSLFVSESREHLQALRAQGAEAVPVRRPDELDVVDGLGSLRYPELAVKPDLFAKSVKG